MNILMFSHTYFICRKFGNSTNECSVTFSQWYSVHL